MLTCYSIRPVVLSAVLVSMKLSVDEENAGISTGLRKAGLSKVHGRLLAKLEFVFLQAVDWQLSADVATFLNYKEALIEASHMPITAQQEGDQRATSGD